MRLCNNFKDLQIVLGKQDVFFGGYRTNLVRKRRPDFYRAFCIFNLLSTLKTGFG